VADSFLKRLVGLQFIRGMPTGEALWLRDCRSIHTAWMRFSIDVYFLDEGFRVVEIRPGVSPWRIVKPRSKSARHVVEAQRLSTPERIDVGLETAFEISAMHDRNK
jgi:uncharacterized membrane protein (UPF0127 family)